jgi:hypothetical protein
MQVFKQAVFYPAIGSFQTRRERDRPATMTYQADHPETPEHPNIALC